MNKFAIVTHPVIPDHFNFPYVTEESENVVLLNKSDIRNDVVFSVLQTQLL